MKKMKWKEFFKPKPKKLALSLGMFAFKFFAPVPWNLYFLCQGPACGLDVLTSWKSVFQTLLVLIPSRIDFRNLVLYLTFMFFLFYVLSCSVFYYLERKSKKKS